MPIQEQNIVFVESQVMDDVPEGGGAATGTVIVDGQMNNVFEDISDLDRAYGRFNLRKIFLAVRTLSTDLYGGAKTVVTALPTDDALGYTLFSSGDPFDTRADAAKRVEAYLYKSSTWPGYLNENHISGMATTSVIQRVGTQLPPVGKTLCIVQDEGLATEKEQYVRVTGVSYVETTFTDASGDFSRWIVTLTLSDALRHDFAGHSASRPESSYSYTGKARIRDTSVADATRYYSSQLLAQPAAIGDLQLRAASMFTQLVPSAQTETPLVNQLLAGELAPVVATAAAPHTQSVANAQDVFKAGGTLLLPSGVFPGSLVGPASTTDDGSGRVLRAGAEVGSIDYGTGRITFNASPGYSLSGTQTVSYRPAVAVAQQTSTLFRDVTAASRRYTWIETLIPTPAPGTLSFAYMAQGNWYVLRDNGLGQLTGADPSYGAGTLSYVTGSMSVTTGALPDAGSQVMLTWATGAHYSVRTTTDMTVPGWTHQIEAGFAIEPGSVTITWGAAGTTETLTDDGTGFLAGDGFGAVSYSAGTLYFRTQTLPDPGTTPTVSYRKETLTTETFTPTKDGNGFVTITLANTPIHPRSVRIEWETIRTKTLTEKLTDTTGGVSYFTSATEYQQGESLSVETGWSRASGGYAGLLYQDTYSASNSTSLTTAQKQAIAQKSAFRQFAESESTTSEGNIVVSKMAFDDGSGVIHGPQAGSIDYTTGLLRFIPTDIVRASSWGLRSSGTVSSDGSGETDSSSDWTMAGSSSFQHHYGWGGTQGTSGVAGTSTTSTSSTAGSSGGESTAESGQWGAESFADTWGDGAMITVEYVLASVTPLDVTETMPEQPITVNLTPTTGQQIVPGSVMFKFANALYVDRAGTLVIDPDPLTGAGLTAGSIDYQSGIATLTLWNAGVIPTLEVVSCLTRYGQWPVIGAAFRTAVSPIKPEALSITATAADGEQIVASADADGNISAIWVKGKVNYEFGTAMLAFGQFGPQPDYVGEGPAPTVWIARQVDPSTIRYNAVAYSYLPLDADILGIDPVRLPADGRVPIYRPGDVVMVMHAADTEPATVLTGGTVELGRTRIAWVRVLDATGASVATGYTLDRATGIVTFTDTAGIAMPVTVRHTVADLRQITDAQISGQLTLARPLTHAYPADESIVASCLIHGDRRARVSATWDQATWSGTWTDSLAGSEATATLDTIAHPITVTNEGAETERWLLRWTSTTNVELIGERRGLVYSGPYTADIAPINPRTREQDGSGGVPYLTIPLAANGGGWSAGNVVRINTVGAIADIWIARAIQQSDEPAGDGADGCELYALGNIDRP